jgi:hypothetical protein
VADAREDALERAPIELLVIDDEYGGAAQGVASQGRGAREG